MWKKLQATQTSITMADTNPIQSFGSTAATNAFVGNQFSGTTHINVNQASGKGNPSCMP